MWPLMLDMTKEESIQNLRNLELEAYSNLVSALRAQGPLNHDKRRLLKETSAVLNITLDRHKAEVRRAISDERLNTIAYHISGQTETIEDWAQEGRRTVPLLPRAPPQTSYSLIADEVAEAASQINKQLPPPAATERKRATPPRVAPSGPSERVGYTTLPPETGKSQPFRVPDVPKSEETKKRKLPTGSENSSLAQHLLGPKLTRIQQIYRQTSKSPKLKQKEILKPPDMNPPDFTTQPQQTTQELIPPKPDSPKTNIIQKVNLSSSIDEAPEKLTSEQQVTIPLVPNESLSAKVKSATNLKPTITINSPIPSPGPSNGTPKSIKVCPPKKPMNKNINPGQKLIVVSNAQTIPTTSILQKTLSVPMSKVTKLNLEKFKIVSNATLPSTFQVTTNKQKVVTLKTSPGKKVIPFSQLQMLNSKGGIKVLPIGGKIIGKNIVTTSSPMIVMNTPPQTVKLSTQTIQENPNAELEISENGVKEEVKDDVEDFESKIDEFQISNVTNEVMEVDETNVKNNKGDISSCDVHGLSESRGEIKLEDTITNIELIEPERKGQVQVAIKKDSTEAKCDISESN